MKYKRFEDLPVWQDARRFTSFVYQLIDKNPLLKKDYALSDQLRRAAVSVLLNISEGFERGSNKDMAHFVDFAKGSSGEVRSINYILIDNKYIDMEDFNKLKQETENLSTQLSNFKKYLLKNDYAGFHLSEH